MRRTRPSTRPAQPGMPVMHGFCLARVAHAQAVCSGVMRGALFFGSILGRNALPSD